MRIDLLRVSCVFTYLLAAHAAWAQPDRATVKGDSVKVYRGMSTGSQVVGVLKAGDVVQVGLSMTGEEGSWCGVSRIDAPGKLGYVPCDALVHQPRQQDAAPAAAPGAHTSEECSRVAEQVFQIAGLNDSVSGFSEAVRGGFEAQLPANIGPTEKRRVTEAFTSAFSPAKMGYRLKQAFVDSCDVETYQQVIAGLTAPLGAKMRRMEASTASPQVQRQVAAYAGTLAQHPPTRERLVLMQRMDDSQGMSAFVVDGIMVSIRSLGAVFGGLTGEEKSVRAKISEPMHNAVLVNLLFTYRAATDREIAQYIELNETQSFKRFDDKFKQAFLDAVAEQSREAGLEMKKLLPRGR